MNRVNVTINYLGVPITNEFVERALVNKIDPTIDWQKSVLDNFFGVSVEHLTKDIFDRYIEVSNAQTYSPILPHSDKLFEKLLSPLRASKRCYCLGEYLASIELSAHVGEMLALLIWQINPIHINGTHLDELAEKKLWSKKFERLGQYSRINILRAFGLIDDGNEELFNDLRISRKSYFHLWESSVSDIKKDALKCFLNILEITHNVLKIEHENGKVKMNKLLSKYLQEHRSKDQ